MKPPDKTALENWLAAVIRGATLTPTALPLCPQLQLYLLNKDYPDGPFSAEASNAIMQNTPYWCFCWASGQAMAQYLMRNPQWVAEQSILDFGSGSGVVGIAAKIAGAKRVVACDIDPMALQASQLNAALNHVDIHCAADLLDINEQFDLALVSDVLYDRENWPLLEAIKRVAAKVLVADSRVKTIPVQGYREIGRISATTLPDLNEFDEFKTVVIYSNEPVNKAPQRR